MDQIDFERQVKNIAEQLWPEAFGGGSEVIDGRERDGVYITEETVHLIECTIARTKDKAEKDVEKLSKLVKKMQKQYPDKGVKGWFITKDELTADQRTVTNTNGYLVVGCSFQKFQSKLIDVSGYINCRYDYPFGSVRDPKTGAYKFNEEYIDIDLTDVKDEKITLGTKRIAEEILNGKTVIIQGHYGVGKSMALKEIYKILNNKYNSKLTTKFPIYLNLRDHHGQSNPVEAIERHARNLGFKNPDHLVRAWRSGYALLILDGYDEIAALGWATKSSTLKEIRYKSMELIREILRNNPSNSGVLLAGRINYFDSIKEIEKAFGQGLNLSILKIGDFTSEQILEYLKKKNISESIPEWIPARPLLLSYLVAKGILSEIIKSTEIHSPAEGWDVLLDEISKRESAIEAGLMPETVREIIEGVSSYARKFQSGLGPIYKEDLEKVFYDKCGYYPDDRALVLLQRLPGLASQDEQDGARYFIDHQFASVTKAGEVLRYIQNPFEYKISSDPRHWQESLDEIGIQLIAIKSDTINSGQLEEALLNAKRIEADVLAIDVLMALNYLGKPWNRESVTFKNVLIPCFELKKENNWVRVKFQDVIFRELFIEEIPDISFSPSFEDCYVGTLVGCSDVSLLPSTTFKNILIDNYETKETTTSALLSLNLPIPQKVGLTILKKLYLQKGGGRQENAFYRGLSTHEQSYIPPVLEYLKQKGVAIPSNKSSKNNVWQPCKTHFGKIRSVLINGVYKESLIEDMTKITL
jgi:NACHT domain-containing protein